LNKIQESQRLEEQISNLSSNQEPERFDVFTIEEAMEAAGGFGLYQWIYCVITSLIFMPAGIFIYNQSLFTLKQIMLCPNPEGGLIL